MGLEDELMEGTIVLGSNTYVDGFELIERLGEGSSALVWKGLPVGYQEPVAIKFLRSEHLVPGSIDGTALDYEARETAQSEMRNFKDLSRARSPNIVILDELVQPVTLVNNGERELHRDSAALVMEIINGRTIESWIQEHKRFSQEQFLQYGYQIASGLAAAHKRGVLHRDLQGKNVMIEDDNYFSLPHVRELVNTVKLFDFGFLATGAHPGVGIIPPECIYEKDGRHEVDVTGEHAFKYDARSEGFELGAICYYMLTGFYPGCEKLTPQNKRNEDLRYELKQKRFELEFTPLREVRPDLDERIVKMVDGLLLPYGQRASIDDAVNVFDEIFMDRRRRQDRLKFFKAAAKYAVAAGAGIALLFGGIETAKFLDSSKFFYMTHPVRWEEIEKDPDKMIELAEEYMRHELERTVRVTEPYVRKAMHPHEVEEGQTEILYDLGEAEDGQEFYIYLVRRNIIGTTSTEDSIMCRYLESLTNLYDIINISTKGASLVYYAFSNPLPSEFNIDRFAVLDRTVRQLKDFYSEMDSTESYQWFRYHRTEEVYRNCVMANTNWMTLPLLINYSNEILLDQGNHTNEQVSLANDALNMTYNSFVSFLTMDNMMDESGFVDVSFRSRYFLDLSKGEFTGDISYLAALRDLAGTVSSGVKIIGLINELSNAGVIQAEDYPTEQINAYIQKRARQLYEVTQETCPWDISRPEMGYDAMGCIMTAQALLDVAYLIADQNQELARTYLMHSYSLNAETLRDNLSGDRNGLIGINVYIREDQGDDNSQDVLDSIRSLDKCIVEYNSEVLSQRHRQLVESLF